MNKIKIGIIGGAGYTGGELVRLAINHPHVNIAFVHSKSNAGKHIYEIHRDLIGDTEIKFRGDDVLPSGKDLGHSIDVLFLCLSHGHSRAFLLEREINPKIKIIDLSEDFRLSSNAEIANRKFVYGLPELNKDEIKKANNIANPGCFATAIQLGLLPLANSRMYGLKGDIFTSGITGSTGAGFGLSETSHFSWRANNIQAYKSLQHQHINEINQSIIQDLPLKKKEFILNFTPLRGDFTRGIYVTSVISSNVECSSSDINNLFKHYYYYSPFTHVADKMIDLKQVVNTNKCLIYTEVVEKKIIVHSAIDNLLKGASGQAVQNMNLMFGLNETEGLKLKANAF